MLILLGEMGDPKEDLRVNISQREAAPAVLINPGFSIYPVGAPSWCDPNNSPNVNRSPSVDRRVVLLKNNPIVNC